MRQSNSQRIGASSQYGLKFSRYSSGNMYGATQSRYALYLRRVSMVTLQVTKSQSVSRVFTEIFKKLQIVLQITVKHVVLLLNFVTMYMCSLV